MTALEFSATVAARDFDLSFSLERGETIAILGPNGAGKSTTLGLLAGLVRADSGSARLEGRTLFDGAATGRGAFAPPHSRGISLLAQDALLFPHLTVLDNVAFGPRSAGARPSAARQTARDWLAEVDALELAPRTPGQLSGGQAQRVAVARALASGPQLLLLDEPLAALDMAAAPTVRRMLRQVLIARTTIIVTHDILDAFTLADRVMVVEGGRIVEQGATREVLERPRSSFAAGLAALNLVTGVRTAHGITTSAGLELRGDSDLAPGTAAAAVVRPTAVTVLVERPQLGASNLVDGTVHDLEPRGDLVRVRSAGFSADIAPGLVAHLDLAIGSAVTFAFDPADVLIYPL